MGHSIWVFVHLMLLVYWLGADLGVLLLARAAKRPELSFAERAFALRMAVVIDLVPRLCFAVMFPVGLHVADSGGYVVVSPVAFLVAWGVSVVATVAPWLFPEAFRRHDGSVAVFFESVGMIVVLVMVGRDRLIRPWTWWKGRS